MPQTITSSRVRTGQWLVDPDGQICKVTKKATARDLIRTRRYEDGAFWDNDAVWTFAEFDSRVWYLKKKPRGAPRMRK